MASSIIILKPVYVYSPEETIKSFQRAVTVGGWGFNKFELIQDSEGTIIGAEGGVFFHDNRQKPQQFVFTIHNVDAYSKESFEWLEPGKELFWAIDIEDIGAYHQQVFYFSVQYFSENTNDYLWLDSLEWTYSAKEIQKLAKMPYCPEWLYHKRKF